MSHIKLTFHNFTGAAAALSANDDDLFLDHHSGMLIPLLAEKGIKMRNNMIGYFYHLNVA